MYVYLYIQNNLYTKDYLLKFKKKKKNGSYNIRKFMQVYDCTDSWAEEREGKGKEEEQDEELNEICNTLKYI